MSMNIHPLQEASVSLLRELYPGLSKPLTRAMITVSNGYYPSLESILSTLEHYKEEGAVIEFVRSNAAVIERAKADLQESRGIAEGLQTKPDQAADDIFSVRSFKLASAYASMKSVSLGSIEELLSKELSHLCNEELVVEISSIREGQESFRTSAELRVRVQPKHTLADESFKADE